MCTQLELEVMCKKPKKKEYHLIFKNNGVKKYNGKNTKKENL
jgi:hypothetical protein